MFFSFLGTNTQIIKETFEIAKKTGTSQRFIFEILGGYYLHHSNDLRRGLPHRVY